MTATKNKTLILTLTAAYLALTFVVTRFLQIPIPLGYFNVGNSVILLAAVMLPLPNAMLVGALGAALADLTSYPVYTVPTLVIKALMVWIFVKIYGNSTPKAARIGMLIGTLVPLFGYTIFGGILEGSMIAGLAQFPGLLLEYIANAVIFSLVLPTAIRLRNKLYS